MPFIHAGSADGHRHNTVNEMRACVGAAAADRPARTVPAQRVVTAHVPAGRYAVELGGVLKFYVVDRPTEGKWAGRVFVNIQAGGELHPVRGRQQRDAVLSAIGADPRAALIRYGREIGTCGRCGRTLTDEASRAAGIGPVCAEKF